MQFEFRKARSTTDAISTVVEMTKKAIAGKGAKTKYCAIPTLDIKNAFNSANWIKINQAFDRIGLRINLSQIIQSCFSDRVLFYDTNDGQKG